MSFPSKGRSALDSVSIKMKVESILRLVVLIGVICFGIALLFGARARHIATRRRRDPAVVPFLTMIFIPNSSQEERRNILGGFLLICFGVIMLALNL